MKQFQEQLHFRTSGKGLVPITEEIRQVVRASEIKAGLCTLFLRHTSASLTIQENADPSVRRDLERYLARLVPEDYDYEHSSEGPDDMPAHIRTVLTQTHLSIPLSGGELVLGTWQGIYLWEHRSRPHDRRLTVHLSGE